MFSSIWKVASLKHAILVISVSPVSLFCMLIEPFFVLIRMFSPASHRKPWSRLTGLSGCLFGIKRSPEVEKNPAALSLFSCSALIHNAFRSSPEAGWPQQLQVLHPTMACAGERWRTVTSVSLRSKEKDSATPSPKHTSTYNSLTKNNYTPVPNQLPGRGMGLSWWIILSGSTLPLSYILKKGDTWT